MSYASDSIDQFTCGEHSFFIAAHESCMIRYVTLRVRVECGRDAKTTPHEFIVYEITEGDYVWNTLVKDRSRSSGRDYLELAPCIPYLRLQAEEFARDHPASLSFGSEKKARQYFHRIARHPLNVRGHPHPAPFPGSTGWWEFPPP